MKKHIPTLSIKTKDPKIQEIIKIVSSHDMDYSLSSSLKIKIPPHQQEVGTQIMKLASDWSLN
jgi:hypothetical protein